MYLQGVTLVRVRRKIGSAKRNIVQESGGVLIDVITVCKGVSRVAKDSDCGTREEKERDGKYQRTCPSQSLRSLSRIDVLHFFKHSMT